MSNSSTPLWRKVTKGLVLAVFTLGLAAIIAASHGSFLAVFEKSPRSHQPAIGGPTIAGAELGVIHGYFAAVHGMKLPPDEALQALAKLHCDSSTVDHCDHAEWQRGFRTGYRLGWTNAPRS
jgi:hypothetical protein